MGRWVRDDRPAAPARTDLVVARLALGEAARFTDLAFRIFSEPPALGPWLEWTMQSPGWSYYVARDGDRPVAVGILYVRDQVGWLGWGGTLESHRGRGGQAALLARRIEDGRAQGCRWFTVETAEDPPERSNPSYRNVARAGFRMLYLRPSYAWFPPPADERVSS